MLASRSCVQSVGVAAVDESYIWMGHQVAYLAAISSAIIAPTDIPVTYLSDSDRIVRPGSVAMTTICSAYTEA